MSGLLQIRDVPERSRQILKERAAARGESLNSYLLEIIEREVMRPSADEVFARIARYDEGARSSSVEVISAERRERERQLLDRRS